MLTLSSHSPSMRVDGCSQGHSLLATSSLTLVQTKPASPPIKFRVKGTCTEYLQGKCKGGAEQRGNAEGGVSAERM